ncbi:MAG: hypothetical protein A3G33_09730 [Omnitrophica bacterium RIFCSPLOWO2_12_FULL_44_17]|uniref:Uncharacterized protein n=1 Tax=Candidatus Danuiimicrobium aquiferis TaxID=1801832 RepID=A0A1G1KXX1_9BACT|nr:MAG: hypothetical protein A3B72_09630 [Omnitrophica bacterium RIFCSPHIGHO2_02_FULL_45_28]OGW89831.1 MAG: hypothetical protein A3E74_02665 [Omnitrophica bacterium RIFCSPHIGHO2_12_FULL_44_12]OGW97459.1 MAG: hypothetical protein A3G33_09730 [Omnitrophica bacterium RIFCSPLOWO2_12_FULL_44_17]OGX04532.1 MAG: hypothetical protein A3J12_10770 [Omnitrophica bacterium RIFCSPLOWO2_02_FULL_44_11]
MKKNNLFRFFPSLLSFPHALSGNPQTIDPRLKHSGMTFVGKKTRFSFLLFLLICGVYTKFAFAQGWEILSQSPAHGKTDFVISHPENPDCLFIGWRGNLYRSDDAGKNWKTLTAFASELQMNHLVIQENRFFLLTSDGVYISEDNGGKWTKIFNGVNPNDQNTINISRDPKTPEIFYLATHGGIFKSNDNGKTWAAETNEFSREVVWDLKTDFENEEMFIASEKGLYRYISSRRQIDRIYYTQSVLSDLTEIETMEETENNGSGESNEALTRNPFRIQKILILPYPFSRIFIGTTRGVFTSDDEGNHWESLPQTGLLNTNVLDLVYSAKAKTVIAGTEKGVFFYDEKSRGWKELYEGLPATAARQLMLARKNQTEILYAATDDGIFFITIDPKVFYPENPVIFSPGHWNLLNDLLREEPPVRAVQKEVILYADVSNWKIKRWQWTSRLRALIPSFSIGKSFSTSNNVDLDRGGTSDADKFIFGPADTDESWDFDLGWDVGDLLFNSAQTSIDSRQKMMVELRNDLLGEITRLYYERRRNQLEFILEPRESFPERMNALLRIDELTANIDAYTNGFLTKALETIYSDQPEFYQLWEAPVENPKVQ